MEAICEECKERKIIYAKCLCSKCYHRLWESNPRRKEYKKGYNQKFRNNHKKYFREYNRDYHQKNKEKIKQRKKRYGKKYYQKHKEHIKEYRKEYYQVNKEEIRKKLKEYRKGYRTRPYVKQLEKESGKKYRGSLKGKLNMRKKNSKRRLCQKECVFPIDLSPTKQKRIFKRDKVCVYCNGDLETIDHIKAIENGGNNDYYNLVGACKSCNSSKGKKDVLEWCKEKGIKVPKIVIELLKKQEEQARLGDVNE